MIFKSILKKAVTFDRLSLLAKVYLSQMSLYI